LSGEPQQALIDPLSAAAVEAGVEICVGSKVIGAERSGAIVIEGGKRLEADLIVGADGIHSVVRRSVAGELALGQHRKGAIRLLIPIHPGDFPDGNNRVATEYNDPSGRRIGLLPCSPDVMYMILVALLADAEAQESGRATCWSRSAWSNSGYLRPETSGALAPSQREYSAKR
jgi:2-polyprenyl-6-methoxyphenol hydroxylase-like FAD-dependent oxidoreductase